MKSRAFGNGFTLNIKTFIAADRLNSGKNLKIIAHKQLLAQFYPAILT